jgi:TonB family protein
MKPLLVVAVFLIFGEACFAQFDSLEIVMDSMAFDIDLNIPQTDDVHVSWIFDSPRFPGCEDMVTTQEKDDCSGKKMHRFIAKYFKYPKGYKGKEGRVYVQFTVDTVGWLRDIKIARGISPELDQACIRVVQKMPRWIPVERWGKKANTRMTIPIDCRRR